MGWQWLQRRRERTFGETSCKFSFSTGTDEPTPARTEICLPQASPGQKTWESLTAKPARVQARKEDQGKEVELDFRPWQCTCSMVIKYKGYVQLKCTIKTFIMAAQNATRKTRRKRKLSRRKNVHGLSCTALHGMHSTSFLCACKKNHARSIWFLVGLWTVWSFGMEH